MEIFAYYLRTESGDEILKLSDKDYENAIEFMKNEFSAEYEAQKEQQELEGFEFDENEIPYATFLKEEKTFVDGKVEKINENEYCFYHWIFKKDEDDINVIEMRTNDVVGDIVGKGNKLVEVMTEIENFTENEVEIYIANNVEYD